MAEKRGARWDPLDALRSLLDRGERSVNELLAGSSASEGLNALRGRLSRLLLDAQRANWELWGRWFRTINVPTRADVIRLGKVLAQVEQRLTLLEGGLRNLERRLGVERARAGAPTPDRPRPRRTRRPPDQAPAEEKR